MQLLEKRPADRPQSAEDLLSVLDVSHTASDPVAITQARLSPSFVRPAKSGPHRRRWLVAGGVATLVLALLLALVARRAPPMKMDSAVVAVAPFRVSGADSSLGYLREGMVDLLAAKLSGTTGIRAADPRSLLAAWRRKAGAAGDLAEQDAIAVAAGIGAGRLIEGDVVGTRQQITINAAVLDARDHRVTAQASVEGSPDSLPRLVDRLAGKLLALEAGEGEQRLASLTSTSLPALRAYLEGQALMRRGEFTKAADGFKRALQFDSTFALAGLGLTRAGLWFGQASNEEGAALAWKHRDKLGPADRALLAIQVGDKYPGPRPWRLGIAAAERFVQLAPDNAEAWFELADVLYHWGVVAGIPDHLGRSAQAFGRSLALDSSFVPALEHGTALALALGDTAGARKVLSLILRTDSTSPWATSNRWVLAHAVGDSSGRREALRTDSVMGPFIMGIALSLGLPLGDADAALRRNTARAVTVQEQGRLQVFSHMNAIITGWPSRAAPLPALIPEEERLAILYLEARFAEGDSLAGAAAGATLEKLIGTPIGPETKLVARYAAGQRAFDYGRLNLAQRAVADLINLRVPPDSSWFREIGTGYALLLESQIAARSHSPQLPRLLRQLDSALVEPRHVSFPMIGNLVASELFEKQANLMAALVVIRRQVWELARSAIQVTYHREEGRLAALNGDREGAIRAYRRYLALRSGAEPRLQRQVAQVRAQLEALERETTDR
jgi:tetratricopeptide (TPR) repeat protein